MSDPFQLAYLGVEVHDAAEFGRYLTEVVGLMPVGSTYPGESRWRFDDKAHRVSVTEGPANDASYVGYEYEDLACLERATARLKDLGFAVTQADPSLAARRQVQQLHHVTAPWGVRVELVTGLATADAAPDLAMHPGGSHTGEHGMGHVVFTVAFETLGEGGTFLVDGLGMALTDYLQRDGAPVRADLFHANGRHHSTALVGLPGGPPQRLNHLMVESASLDNVGRAFDRAVASGLPIPRGLGKHDNDGMFSLYAETPAGFQIEVGTGGVVVDERWEARRYERASAWGHQPFTPAEPEPVR